MMYRGDLIPAAQGRYIGDDDCPLGHLSTSHREAAKAAPTLGLDPGIAVHVYYILPEF